MVAALRREFQLPGTEPALVLVGSSDPAVVTHLDEALIAQAEAVDIRSGVAWLEVPNGRSFLDHLVSSLTNGSSPPAGVMVKIAVAELDASATELVERAMMAVDVQRVAHLLEQEALASSELEYEIRYQPIVRLSDRSVVGYEAMIRGHLHGEIVRADDLIARATRGNWLAELDQMSRELAIRGVGSWLGAGLLFLNIMAPGGTFDLAAARRTIQRAEDTGLEPDQLVFETAERNRYTDIDLAAAQLNKIRNAGVRIAIDDVGDGYSSLRVATRFKPDVLKLAGDLIDALPGQEAIAIISAVVDLAHQTGAWVVAESVETEAQADLLRTLDVDWGQGLIFGGPEPRSAD